MMSNEGKKEEQGTILIKKEKKSFRIVIIIVILALVIIGGIIYYLTNASPMARLRKQLDLGNQYLEEMQYEQAIAAFENAISIDPKNEDAYLGLAEAYLGLGDYESTIEVLDEGIREFEELDSSQGESAVEKLAEYRADVEEDWEEQKASQRQLQEELLNRIEELSDNIQNVDNNTDDLSETENITNEAEVEAEEEIQGPFADVRTGDIVTFGTYEQDNNLENGSEPIKWYVLNAGGGKALLLSVYILDCKPYDDNNAGVTWENCTLRSWLNSEFYNTAFGDDEKSHIILSNIENNAANSTDDYIFLLSNEELEPYVDEDWITLSGIHKYLNAAPTPYALANGVYEFPDDSFGDMEIYYGGRLWSRTPGCVLDVDYSYGGMCVLGTIPVNDSETGVRPAMWVDTTGGASSVSGENG
ncbi:MAG: DUF6273 domain-containing protein [Lachnospiraceae bacterium]